MTFPFIHPPWYTLPRRQAGRLISLCVVVTFVATMIITPRASYAQAAAYNAVGQGGVMGLPAPGTMVDLSPAYVPLMLTGLSVHPENPLLMDFIVSTGNSGLNAAQVKKESGRLIKYFLACLTIPENNQWVNLSPYEKDRIIPKDLGQTVLGRDMLEEDYLLKQLTASLINPEKNLGKNFWDKVYAKANQMYGTTQIPVNTFNKVWILPDTAKVYEHKDTVFVVKSHLKVMLDEDYLALNKHVIAHMPGVIASPEGAKQSQINNLGNQIVREIILPAIEQEVNAGKNFAQLRQIYNSMILAVWFKKNLKQALLNQVYTDRAKVNGVNVNDPAIKEKIYKQYLQAYKKGVFNYIKEDFDQNSQELIPRKYFSGGLTPFDAAMLKPATLDEAMAAFSGMPGEVYKVSGVTENVNGITNGISGDVVIGSSPEQVDEVEGRNSDSGMVTSIQIARGVSYWKGKTAATIITRPFRASRQEDVTDITNLSPAEKLRLEKIAVQSLLQGQGVIAMMVAGASSRMNVKDAPEEVKSIADHNIESKAGVPIGVVNGQLITYLDAFGINVSRLENQVAEEAQRAGFTNNLAHNDVLLMSNDAYRSEHEGIVAAHNNYGLPQQIGFFNQPLESIYWATPADVKKLNENNKFKTDADYKAALAKAQEVQVKLNEGDQEAVVVKHQLDPLGHGEFLHQLVVSGELLRMFQTGKKWFFVKNVDNYAAKFDRVWLQILGRFLDQQIDFQPEVSPRAPGQSGGSLVVMEDTGSQQLVEDPTLRATLGPDGKPKVNPADSFWFNDAVAFGRPEYVASLYFKPGQTLDGFLAEYTKAVENHDKGTLEAIAERGRAKFPKLLDPKLAKNEPGATVKIETNMWQSTGVAPANMRVQSIGVRGARNFKINEYSLMNPQEKQTELANLRFLATKQWDVSSASRAETKHKLEKLLGREVTDAEVDLTLESYAGNKRIADDLLKYILGADLMTKGILSSGGNPAMVDEDKAMLAKLASRAGTILLIQLRSRENPFGRNDELYLSQAIAAGFVLSHLDRPEIAKLKEEAISTLRSMIESRGLLYNIKAIAAGAVLDHLELFQDILSSAENALSFQLESRENPFGRNDELYLSQAFAAGFVLSHLDRPEIAKLKEKAISTLRSMIESHGLSYNIKAIAAGAVLDHFKLFNWYILSSAENILSVKLEANANPFGGNDKHYFSQAFVAGFVLDHLDRPQIAKLKETAISKLRWMIDSEDLPYNIRTIAAGAVLKVSSADRAMTAAVPLVNKVALKKGAEILRSIQTNIERGYDVRGIAIGPKATMTPETLYAAGVALGLELNSRVQGHHPKVLVTGDQRSTTPALRQAVSEGLASQGIDVDFTNELVSTPAANIIPRLPGSGYDAEVQITASHNPWTKYIASEGNKLHDPENGFKINIRQPDGQFRGIFGQGMWNILKRSIAPEAEESNPKPGEIKEVKVMNRYYDHLAQLIEKNLIALGLTLKQAQDELILVVDTGNALMGPVAKEVIQGRLGIQYVGVDDEVISGVEGIPVHEADPSKRPVYAQHLTGEVQKVAQRQENKGKIVIGLAFDGDGDRIGMTDENGSQYLTPNQQGYFFFSRIKETNPHSAVVLDIRMGQEILELLNLKPENAKWHAPGWAIVREAMQKFKAAVAVEGSHHTMLRQFEDHNTDAIDDGLYAGLFAAIQALKLKTIGRSIHQLLDRNWYPSLVEELRPAVAESTPGERYDLMPKIAENLKKEVESVYQGARILSIPSPGERGAVRLQISDSNGSFIGWILIRASNTSPRLSMQAQGRDKPTIKQLAKILSGVLSQFDKVNQKEVQNVLAKTLSDSAQLSIYAQDDEMSLGRDRMQPQRLPNQQRLLNQKKDNAMNTPGGIDINARNLNMESSGQKVNITFDPAMIEQFKRGDFSGVKIQILNVVPINLMPLLGLKEGQESGRF